MINPLRSEAEAYRFLLLTVGYFAAIAIAALVIGTWAGIIVFLVAHARRGRRTSCGRAGQSLRDRQCRPAAGGRTSAASS